MAAKAKTAKTAAKGKTSAPARKAKAAPKVAPKPTTVRDHLQPEPKAKALLKKLANEQSVGRRDAAPEPEANAKQLVKLLAKEKYELNPAQAGGDFEYEHFDEFFQAEIDAEVAKDAEIFHDRFARWPCQCCDVIIPVPRRTEVFHGDYHLVHDDILGLLVNGERWIPRAETPIEVQQPGRLRNPWTGKTLEGKTLGTTGVYG